MTPTVFIQFLSKFNAIPELVVFFHLRPLSTPSVPPENRYTVTRTVVPTCYRLVIRHGYTDEVVTEDLALLVYEQLHNFLAHEGARLQKRPFAPERSPADQASSTSASSAEHDNAASQTQFVAARLAELQKAYETQVVYIVGKEQMRIRAGSSIVRRILLNAFLWLRENTRGKIASMKIPTDKLVEVGFVKEV